MGLRRCIKLAAPVAAILAISVALASAAVVQQGNLRITLLSQVQPYKLPRIGTSPIAVFIAGRIASPKGGVPAQLQRMSVKVNRHAHFQSRGPSRLPAEADPTRDHRGRPSALRPRGNRLRPVLGSDRLPRTGLLPDPGAAARIQRTPRWPRGPFCSHLHGQPVFYVLRHPLRDPQDRLRPLRH